MTGGRPEHLDVWRRFLQASAALVDVLDAELQRECGLPLTWYDVLVNLHEAPGHALRMHDLADAVLLSRSGLTRVVDRLVAAGYVERRACASDRRGLHAALTPEGERALRRAAPVHLRGVEEYFTRHLDESSAAALDRTLASVLDAAGSGAVTRTA